MKLSLEQIRKITYGVESVFKTENGVGFSRFTEEERALFLPREEGFILDSYAPSAVKLRFTTDAKEMFIKVKTTHINRRQYFSLDVIKNGVYFDNINNYEGVSLPLNYTTAELPCGEFEKTFELGEIEKTITIFLPSSVKTEILELNLIGATFITPKPYTKKAICYGDSITQGYDTLKTSNSYVNKILEAFDTEGISKAICGEVFLPSLPKKCTIENPDFITVAYGTNDWRKVTKKEYIRDCTAFYKILSNKYKNSKIFAITPLWRKDLDMKTDFRDFLEPTEIIENAVKDLKNVTLIKAYDFIPKKEENFADQRLHPNDKGFAYFANELIKELKKHI